MNIFKLLSAFLLLTALSAFAGDPLVRVQEGPEVVIFTISHEYKSSFRKNDIDAILNPKNGRIQDLFKDPISVRSIGSNKYKVSTVVDAKIKTYDIENVLDYSNMISSTQSAHIFNFHDFTHLFRESHIKVDVIQAGSDTKVIINQTAKVKGSTYARIKKYPFGSTIFKKQLIGNVKKFEKGTGGR